MPSVEVQILGHKYTLKADAPEEHIREIASFIESKISETNRAFPNMPPLKAMLLTLFNVSDELNRLKLEQQDIAVEVGRKTELIDSLVKELN